MILVVEGVPKNGHGELDLGADRDSRTKPCARRLDCIVEGEPTVVWCVLDDEHEGACQFAFPRRMPRSDFLPKRREPHS